MYQYPIGLIRGGLEMGQTLRTFQALKALDIPVEFLDSNSTDSNFDILHVFGCPVGVADLCSHCGDAKKIVISAVLSARRISTAIKWARQGASLIASMTRDETGFGLRRDAFRKARHVICLNELEQTYAMRMFDLPPDRLSVIVGGVWPQYFEPNGELFRQRFGRESFVLFVGSITPRKNPLQVARALVQLGYPGVFIGGIVPGDEAYARRFSDFIAQNSNLFLWLKDLPFGDPLSPSAYGAAAVFCMPSSSETQSGAALEGVAAGLPLVLGDYPYAYQAPFEQALRCKPEDLPSLVACIERAMKERYNERKPLSRAYTWEHAAGEIAKIYLRVMERD
jgi:glycosyltransferase involved in cell wall biosynthesis